MSYKLISDKFVVPAVCNFLLLEFGLSFLSITYEGGASCVFSVRVKCKTQFHFNLYFVSSTITYPFNLEVASNNLTQIINKTIFL